MSSAATLRRVDGEEPGRPVEKRRGRPTLVAIERAPSCAREHRTAFQRDRTGLVRDPSELRTRDVCLLEVVSDELVVARHLLVTTRLEPRREARVEVGAKLLRHRRIGDVPDEHVVEPEAVVALVERAVGAEQLLPREGEQRAAQPIGLVRGQKLGDRAAVEQPTFDRGALQHRTLPRLEAIDPGREERLDRRRHRLVRNLGIVGEHGEHLLDEQRIALGGVDDPVAKRRR